MARKKLYFEEGHEGAELPSFTVENLTRTDFVKYAGSSGDFNPIHHDQTFAEASGNPTVFAMGMLNAGLLSRLVAETPVIGEQIELALRSFNGEPGRPETFDQLHELLQSQHPAAPPGQMRQTERILP